MTGQNREKMADLRGLTPATPVGQLQNVAYPLETRIDKGIQGNVSNNNKKDLADPTLPTIPLFVNPVETAELTGWGLTTVKRHCREGKFQGAQKTLIEGNESWQIPIPSLPPEAQAKLAAEVKAAIVARAAEIAPLPQAPAPVADSVRTRMMFDAYQRSGKVNKERAEAAHAVLTTFEALKREGYSIGEAEKATLAKHNVSRATLYRHIRATKGYPVCEWLPRLSPKFKGGRPMDECSEEAYAYILGEYLNTSKTPLSVVMVHARALAKSKGWVIPNDSSIWNRIKKEPKWVFIAGRDGPQALEQSQPPAKRDHTTIGVNEVWFSDGHKVDLFCLWPDGTIARPFVIAWTDARSRAVLGFKGYRSAVTEGVLASFGQAMKFTRCAPKYAKIDNGREYAAKAVTGGQANRYRNKVIPGEPIGVMTHVGTEAIWSKPARGQDKDIERFWGMFLDYVAKFPGFEGAYCGKDTASKPEGFKPEKHAVPIAVFSQAVAAFLNWFNNEHRHTGDGMNGRTPAEVYVALKGQNPRPPVDPAYIEMCYQGAAQIKPDRSNVYTLKIPGYGECRYYSEDIANLSGEVVGRKHNVYYDLEEPDNPVSIYDGMEFLGFAACEQKIPLIEEGGERAAQHVKRKNATMKPQLAAVKQLKANAAAMRPDGIPALTHGPAWNPSLTVEVTNTRPRREAPQTPPKDEWITSEDGEIRNQTTGQRYVKSRLQRELEEAEANDQDLYAMTQDNEPKKPPPLPSWARTEDTPIYPERP